MKEQLHVSDGAGHWADRTERRERTDAGRQMSHARNTAWCGLERTDAGAMCRKAHRAAAVAAESSSGHARGDRRRLTSARTAWCVFEVPGIVGTPIENVVGDVSHQIFRAICHTQNHGSRSTKACHHLGVFLSNAALIDYASDLTPVASCRYRRLYRNRQPPQSTELFCGSVNGTRLLPHTLGIEIHKCIDLRVQPLNLAKVLICQFK